MRHIVFGGNGFVGTQLARNLVAEGEEVVVADIERSNHAHYTSGRGSNLGAARFVQTDVRDPASVNAVEIGVEDAVYNMSAKMLAPLQIRANRYNFFWPVNHSGASNILAAMDRAGASRFVQFTTDMIYGHTVVSPQTEDHPQAPLGEYGKSKLATEKLCLEWRKRGMNISIFRPRLIIGPGRLGILEKLFKLIDFNLPVPMIGSGKAPYQFISVYDCAEAARLAWKNGFPNSEYNLGSNNPPSVRELLTTLINHAGSKSVLIPTPGFAVKKTLALFDLINKPIMDPEQYLIADEMCVRETGRARDELGFIPQYRDTDMLMAAYDEYRAKKAANDRYPSTYAAAAE